MPDKALENAKALKMQANIELERLNEEMRVWRDRIAAADNFIEQWNAFASGDALNLVDSESQDRNKQAPTEAVKRKTVRNSKKEDVATAAIEIIRERGEPMSRSNLYAALIERGMTIEGTDPEMVLSTMLWRMKDKITRVKGGGYWPADTPNPEVGYDPATAKEIDAILETPASQIPDPESDAYKDAKARADYDDLLS